MSRPPQPVDVLDSPAAGGTAIRGSAVRAAGYVAALLLGLAAVPLLTRHLGVVAFGRYTQVLSLIALVAAVTEAGLGALGVRELAVLEGRERDRLMRNLLGVRVVLTVAGVAAAAGFALLAGYGTALTVATMLAGVGLLAYVLQGTFALALFTDLRLGSVALAEILRQAVLVALIVAMVALGVRSLVPFLALPIAGGSITLALTAWLVRERVPWRPAFDVVAWRRILRETLPLAASGAIYSVYFRVVILAMSLLATGLQTGYFALSFRVVEVLVAVPFLLVGSFFPIFARAARDDPERLRYAFQRTFDVALIVGGWLTLATFLGAPVAIAVLADHAPGPAVDALRIQSFTILAAFVNVTYGSAFVALRRSRDLVAANALAVAVTVVSAVALVPWLGARGGAVAATAGESALIVAYVVLLSRARPDLRPALGAAPRVLAAASLAAAAGVLVNVPSVPNVGAVVIATVVFFAVLAALRGVPPELLAALSPRRSAAKPPDVAHL